MKVLLLLTLIIPSFVHAGAELDALVKEQRKERHEERKKFEISKEECKNKFPNWTKASHSDYDGYFACSEAINDAEVALDRKQEKEICDKLNVGCDNLK